ATRRTGGSCATTPLPVVATPASRLTRSVNNKTSTAPTATQASPLQKTSGSPDSEADRVSIPAAPHSADQTQRHRRRRAHVADPGAVAAAVCRGAHRLAAHARMRGIARRAPDAQRSDRLRAPPLRPRMARAGVGAWIDLIHPGTAAEEV